MLKIVSMPVLLTLPLLVVSMARGACVPDPPEIGDIGPDSERVCKLLESAFPTADIAVLNREIKSPTRVSIDVSVNGRRQSVEYDLRGFDWSPVNALYSMQTGR